MKHLSADYVDWFNWSDIESVCYYYEYDYQNKQKMIFFADSILVSINCDLRLPLDKITYFEDVIIRFNCVDKIVHREKKHAIL